MYRVVTIMLGIFISTQSIAHSGHDHNDPISSLIHLLWIAPFAFGLFLFLRYIKQRLNRIQDKPKG